jgi:hypothetical protein
MSDRHLTISADAPGPDRERLLQQIHHDLRRAGVRSEPVGAGVATGAKGGDGTLTSVVVSGLVSAAGLRALSQWRLSRSPWAR